MGSVAEKLAYLQETKSQLYDVLGVAGIKMAESDSFRGYADKLLENLGPDGYGIWTPRIVGYEDHPAVHGNGVWTKSGDMVSLYGRVWTTQRLDPGYVTTTTIPMLKIAGLPFVCGKAFSQPITDWPLPLDCIQQFKILENGLAVFQYQEPPEFIANIGVDFDYLAVQAHGKLSGGVMKMILGVLFDAITDAIPELVIQLTYQAKADDSNTVS